MKISDLFKSAVFVCCLSFIAACGGGSSDAATEETGDGIELWLSLPAPINELEAEEQEVLDIFNSMFTTPVFETSDSTGAIQTSRIDSLPLADSGEDDIGYTTYLFDDGGLYDVEIFMLEEFITSDLPLYQLVFAHELGHALGAPHMDTGIMRPFLDGDDDIEEEIDDGLTLWLEENYDLERL